MKVSPSHAYLGVIEEIAGMDWTRLSADDMTRVAWAYYYFSVQFRESLQVARRLFPGDGNLIRLEAEECGTDNLSPWPGVAAPAEKMDHDEFMRRTLALTGLDDERSAHLSAAGRAYLREIERVDPLCRALSIASYEDGGLETVFRAILTFNDWNTDALRAFEHFLSEHVRFDSDPEQGHGALSRHMMADDRVLPLWLAFRDLLATCVPRLLGDRDAPVAIEPEGDRSHAREGEALALSP